MQRAELAVEVVEHQRRRGAIGCKVECDNGMTVACEEVCVADREYLRLHLPGQLHHEAITPRRDRRHALGRHGIAACVSRQSRGIDDHRFAQHRSDIRAIEQVQAKRRGREPAPRAVSSATVGLRFDWVARASGVRGTSPQRLVFRVPVRFDVSERAHCCFHALQARLEFRGFAGEGKADETFAAWTEFRATPHGDAMPKAMFGQRLGG